MKKFILSLSLILVFVAYALYQNGTFGSSVYVADNGSTPTSPENNSNQIGIPLRITAPKNSTPPATPVKKPTPTPSQPIPTPKPPVISKGLYNDGEYTGDVADAYYGNVQVKAIIQNGKIYDVQFLDYPQDRGTSIRINSIAMPQLTSEAISAQSASVNGVSGATATSGAFRQSLSSALAQAKN